MALSGDWNTIFQTQNYQSKLRMEITIACGSTSYYIVCGALLRTVGKPAIAGFFNSKF